MKTVLKNTLEYCGVRCSRISRTPVGVDVCLDIRRLSPRLAPKVVFDVGANVGNVTRKFANRFRGSRIFSFEPFTATFETLVSRTSHLPSVRCTNSALGAQPETMSVVAQQESEWNSLVPELRPRDSTAPVVSVRVETV